MAQQISRIEKMGSAMRDFGKALFGSFETPVEETVRRRKEAFHMAGGGYPNVFAITYNGEKNLGEIGPALQYMPDYQVLGMRGWQFYLESEITQIIFGKYVKWLIGKGLKMNAEPEDVTLASEGIELESEDFNEVIESRFAVWACSKEASSSGMESLNAVSRAAWLNSKVGGDVLVILQIDKSANIRVRLIDTAHLQSPAYGTDYYAEVLQSGNCIRNGIEINPDGGHVAYYVRQKDMSFKRIEAKSKSTGLTMAYLVYGFKYRLDNTRGLPLVCAVFESMKKMDRYKEATLGTAEEQAKIAYQVYHQQFSTGENPLAKGSAIARSFDADANIADDLPRTQQGEQLASRVHATTNKQVYNMPIGSEIKTLQHSNGQQIFKDFFSTNIDIVCAVAGIPPSVAMSVYNDSFSASRMAVKDWDMTLDVGRDDFKEQFYQPIYDLFLHLQVLQNKIQAPGYLSAFYADNRMALNAYRTCRFTGPKTPHIDPLKEVKAVREALGPLGANIPLMTVEQGVEILGGTDSDSNIEQFAKERELAEELGLDVDRAANGAAPVPPVEEDAEDDKPEK